MASKDDILQSMQYTSLIGTKINREISGVSEGVSALKTITYQFAGSSQPVDFFSYDRSGWSDFTATDKAALLKAFTALESFLNVKFVESAATDTDPDLNLGKIDIPGATEGSTGYEIDSETVDIDPDPVVVENQTQITRFDSFALFDNSLDLNASYARVLQVLGHAMGLKNSFVGPVVPDGTDNQKYTVMSNQLNPDTNTAADGFGVYDIIALQDLWGAKAAGNSGDTTYIGDSADALQLVMDADGTDIFDASAKTTAVTLDLREGASSIFDTNHELLIAYDTVIENAKGGKGNDTIDGNDTKNLLIGLTGKDTISGHSGNDTLNGNKGNDILNGGEGKDILKGGKGSDKLFGAKGNDDLKGGNGKDYLNGGAGDDMLTGGANADKFVFGDAAGQDTITDFADNVDILKFQRSDVSSVADVVGFGADVAGDVVFSFTDGTEITVNGITLSNLTDDISIA